MIVIASALLAAVVAWSARAIVREMQAARGELQRGRTLTILSLFRPGLDAAQGDPRALLIWQPLARAARELFPEEFAVLDRVTGATFPFDAARMQAAHARWTADWLAWERTHDAEYKQRAAVAEQELYASGAAAARARLDSIEREKLELYQRRYEEYVRVAKALQALSGSS